MKAVIARQTQVVDAISGQLLKYIKDPGMTKDYAVALGISIDKLVSLKINTEPRYYGEVTGSDGVKRPYVDPPKINPED